MRAVLVIDMLNEFVTGKFGFEGAREIVPRIKRVLEWARRGGIPIIYVCDSHEPGDPELRVWGEHAMKGTEGAKIVPELSPSPGDLVIEKRTYSAFFSTQLDQLLKDKKIQELILMGLVTNICVQHTAADAFFRGYKIRVLTDCTASPVKEEHERALQYMKQVYGAELLSSEELR